MNYPKQIEIRFINDNEYNYIHVEANIYAKSNLKIIIKYL